MNALCLSVAVFMCIFVYAHNKNADDEKLSLPPSPSHFNRCCLFNEDPYGLVYKEKLER